MTSTYIETGSRIRVYDSAVRAHEALPAGTYRVHFDPKEGFSLVRTDDINVGEEKVYGDRERTVAKIFDSYGRMNRSLGVMLSGDKGQGKSLFLRMVGQYALERDLPVILVNEDAYGIAEFLDTLDECVIIFDEFEKTFPCTKSDHDGANRQHQFLSLFDGMSSVKRIYCLTVNDIRDVSEYIVNRPGRFHYHIRFSYPKPEEVREYLRDNAPLASEVEIENAVLFSRRVKVNYDHLRAIAFELNSPEVKFSDIVGDLNIKAVEPSTYRVEARFSNGTVLSDELSMNLFERGDVGRTIELRDKDRELYFSFTPKDLVFEDDAYYIPVDKMDVLDQDDEELADLPIRVSLTLLDQPSFAYSL